MPTDLLAESMNDEIALSLVHALLRELPDLWRYVNFQFRVHHGGIPPGWVREVITLWKGRRSANPPRSVTRSIVALTASAISGAWSLIFWIEHKPLAIDYLAVLSDRHVDAGAALSIG